MGDTPAVGSSSIKTWGWFISKLCDPVIVMAEGGVLTTGSAQEVMANDSVIESYLGAGHRTRNPRQ